MAQNYFYLWLQWFYDISRPEFGSYYTSTGVLKRVTLIEAFGPIYHDTVHYVWVEQGITEINQVSRLWTEIYETDTLQLGPYSPAAGGQKVEVEYVQTFIAVS